MAALDHKIDSEKLHWNWSTKSHFMWHQCACLLSCQACSNVWETWHSAIWGYYRSRVLRGTTLDVQTGLRAPDGARLRPAVCMPAMSRPICACALAVRGSRSRNAESIKIPGCHRPSQSSGWSKGYAIKYGYLCIYSRRWPIVGNENLSSKFQPLYIELNRRHIHIFSQKTNVPHEIL